MSYIRGCKQSMGKMHNKVVNTAHFRSLGRANARRLPRRSPALRSGERGRGSGIRLSARRRANKRLEQTLRVVK